jgi:Porin subfamily
MHRVIAAAQARSIVRGSALAAATIMVTIAVGSSPNAQTLINPNPHTTGQQPRAAARSPASGHVKSCAAYGAGFVNVPGTDACVKIGGYVSGEVTVRPGR